VDWKSCSSASRRNAEFQTGEHTGTDDAVTIADTIFVDIGDVWRWMEGAAKK
jgi:hypothetical protein